MMRCRPGGQKNSETGGQPGIDPEVSERLSKYGYFASAFFDRSDGSCPRRSGIFEDESQDPWLRWHDPATRGNNMNDRKHNTIFSNDK